MESKTKSLLKAMLKENTGKSLGDSGSLYGRNYERNQNINLDKTPRISWEFYGDGKYDATVNVYHYLNDVVVLDEFSTDVNRYLKRQRAKDIDAHWVQDCAELLKEKYGIELKGDVTNTYNYDGNISQVLQFMVFSHDAGDGDVTFYCLLQVHGGCDVRGGYTDTQCFKLTGYLTGQVDVYATLKDGTQLDSSYYGYKLSDDSGKEYSITAETLEGYDFYVTDELYMYAY
jgi:hypothetical protein